jgi:hypothetical protein
MLKALGESDAERAAAAKVIVAQEFRWQRLEDTSPQEFYVRDAQGRLLWLKARSGRYENTSWDWTGASPIYDLFVGIIVAVDGEITTVFQAPRATVERLKHVNQDSCRLRWNKETKAAVDYVWGHRNVDR